jgi:hypothetical protein
MINLKCIDRIEIDDIANIINEKNTGTKKVKLLELKSKILERYSTYIEIESNNRIKAISFSVEEKEALSGLYSSKTKTAKKITEEILNVLNPTHADHCLYCGIGEIDQIDHYLPQEHFPEYSILHKNLIPICGKCNEIKGDHIAGSDNKDFLHLIYDMLPIESIFKCVITYDSGLPQVDFSVIPKFNSGIVGMHFSTLSLKPRIEKKSVQYFLQIKALSEEYGRKYTNGELLRDFNRNKSFFGIYNWKTELIKEMIDTAFLEKI